jgi:hypothetical protein
MNPTMAKLRDVMNTHDAERMAALFSPDYKSEQPAHPNRGFSGHAQVAANWGHMFSAVPDMRCELAATAENGATVWSEWVWRGHYAADGAEFEARGVTVMEVTGDGLVGAARLYMEQVEKDGAAIDETVQQLARTSR